MRVAKETRQALVDKARKASNGYWKQQQGVFVFVESVIEDVRVAHTTWPKDAAFIAASSPGVVLGILQDEYKLACELKAIQTEAWMLRRLLQQASVLLPPGSLQESIALALDTISEHFNSPELLNAKDGTDYVL